ncbi:MAG: (2Fe-2S) ferredoxin domain-containing protein [Gemmatimonadetes bacterium]|nr:(2Fe-2S) ferredoxin domain-containing protein [Gemmatimonadota bacterium]MYB60595.1 (2Fe-2S) ferredoxin domain-containing protein [Gemmatimonadota bacterium]MYB62960.1 (2Fe-2S) ferredoxin domain-containing protein [Gemmatimonadota bacterium]
MNAQTQRIRESLRRHDALATGRGRVLGQVVCCEGCSCGQTDKGFPPFPRDWLKQQWKEEKLNRSVQLTISGCLGPCDLANVFCVISPEGMQWFGGLQEQWHYDLLLAWAKASRDAGVLLELPAEMNLHRFERFAISQYHENGVDPV